MLNHAVLLCRSQTACRIVGSSGSESSLERLHCSIGIVLNHIGSCRINWIHDDLQAVLLDQFLTDVLRQVRAAQVARVGEEVMVSRLTSD